jgi:hypothetical protein
MINVLTVHWHNPRWIAVQLRYLERNLGAPYRVYASLNGIAEPELGKRFFYAEDLAGSHPAKLNELAARACERSESSDLLVFLDGDAFPIRPLVPWIERTLEAHPLAAVRRDENLGDRQPHPSFCATTVGLWTDIEGDWRPARWLNDTGKEVSDTGGRLLHALQERQIEWLPLLRTNTSNPHPLWFGVYDHRIYHHGGGFQAVRAERVDWADRYRTSRHTGRALRPTPDDPSLGVLRSQLRERSVHLGQLRPRHLRAVGRATVKSLRLRREHRFYERHRRSEHGRSIQALSDQVFAQLSSDPEFYRQFDDAATP